MSYICQMSPNPLRLRVNKYTARCISKDCCFLHFLAPWVFSVLVFVFLFFFFSFLYFEYNFIINISEYFQHKCNDILQKFN